MSSTIRILTPGGGDVAQAAASVPLLASLRGKTVGVIDNSKKNFDNLAAAMAEVLKRDYGAADVLIRRKRLPSLPAPAEVIAELTERCDLVITGSGD